jgi:low affinity Fe/Cu permease
MVNTVTEASSSAHMPSDVSSKLSWFDRFAGAASDFASRAWFFAFCVLLVLLWAPSYFLIRTVDTWQLIINTLTTIVTFLMVALLQNSQTRADAAVQDKLNAVAAALASLMESEAGDDSRELRDATKELRRAVGLEDRESS